MLPTWYILVCVYTCTCMYTYILQKDQCKHVSMYMHMYSNQSEVAAIHNPTVMKVFNGCVVCVHVPTLQLPSRTWCEAVLEWVLQSSGETQIVDAVNSDPRVSSMSSTINLRDISGLQFFICQHTKSFEVCARLVCT